MYFARKHIASHRKTCYMYRYIRQCVYCDEMHPREEDHDCEEGRAARRKKRMQMMREKREREKKEQKALEKIAVPLKKNSDFMVDEYDVEGSMQVEESDGTFVDCRLYRHKSKKHHVSFASTFDNKQISGYAGKTPRHRPLRRPRGTPLHPQS